MTPYTVIGGYLGAGKTTLLNHLLKNAQGQRIALLINDFGEINIDAALISSQTDKQINLTNGCVCCTLSDGFGEALDTLLEMEPKPDQIVVEASGVANVQNLAQYGYGHDLQLDGVVVLADAETVKQKANDKYVAQTVRRQLSGADIILLNKCDLVSNEQLKDVKAWLTQEYDAIPVVETSYAEVPQELLSSIHHQKSLDAPSGHEHYATCSVTGEQPIKETALRDFIEQLPEYVLRAKGFAQLSDGRTMIVQIVGKRRELTVSSKPQNGFQIISIGSEHAFNSDQIQTLAKMHLK